MCMVVAGACLSTKQVHALKKYAIEHVRFLPNFFFYESNILIVSKWIYSTNQTLIHYPTVPIYIL